MKFRSVWLNLLQVHLCGNAPQETQAPDYLKRRLSKQPHILIQKIKSLVEGKKNQVHSNHKSCTGTRNHFVFSISSLQWKALTSVSAHCQQCSQSLTYAECVADFLV